jgi:type II/IV secretion system protein
MTASSNLRRKVKVSDIPGPDFTVYSTDEPESDSQPSSPVATQPSGNGKGQPGSPPPKNPDSYDGSFAIHTTDANGNSIVETGRGLACPAYAGNYWSITLRCDAPNKRPQQFNYSAALEAELVRHATMLRAAAVNTGTVDAAKLKAKDFLGYCPKGYADYAKVLVSPAPAGSISTGDVAGSSSTAGSRATTGEIFLNDIYPICKRLYDDLSLDPAGSPFGLIAITGATNSSKSLIARGLIFLFLEAAARHALEKGLRRPHLVTFEDPVEEYFIKNPMTDLCPENLDDLTSLLAAFNIDYTPRQKEIDTDGLSNVIKDAKRQTPAVLFVGETRDSGDWKALLDFGSSGHLVFTTSHSGSVVEAMSQILRNTDAETPSQRSEVARRIRGIANIRGFTQAVKNQDNSLRTLLPALWKSTSQSINNLVADGLSSILPALGQESELGYYGRTYFARSLVQQPTDRFKQIPNSREIESDIVRKAMEWDIRGI